MHGYIGVLPPYIETSLGRILEQVLQGNWIQILSLLFRSSVERRDEEKMIMKIIQLLMRDYIRLALYSILNLILIHIIIHAFCLAYQN